jgi:hypothetical protein
MSRALAFFRLRRREASILTMGVVWGDASTIEFFFGCFFFGAFSGPSCFTYPI